MPNYELAAERAARRHGIDPKIFKAMIRQESGFRQNVKSGAGARDIAQFIPSTAKAYGVTLGDNRVSDDLDGAARYLKDNLEKYGSYHRALSAYNSGRPDTYKDPSFAKGQTYNYVRKILGAAKGETTSGGSVPSSSGPSSRTVTKTRTIPGVDNSDTRKALILSFLQRRHDPQALIGLASGLRDAQDVPAAKASSTRTVKVKGHSSSVSGHGSIKIAPGANQPGRDLTPGITKVLRSVAAQAGQTLTVGTGTNHNKYTVNGNVSDHYTGNATDVPSSGSRLTRLGQEALIAAGMDPAQARKQKGGLFNLPYGKHRRIQIIFNTNEGGNHYNHLHVGVTGVRGR